MVRRRGRSFAGLVELYVAVLLPAAADAAVALCVQEGAAVAHGTPLEFPFAQLDGAAPHAQDETLAVVVEAVLPTQGCVDVGEGHACRHTLLVGWPHLWLATREGDGGRGMVVLEGVHTVIAVRGILGRARKKSLFLGGGLRFGVWCYNRCQVVQEEGLIVQRSDESFRQAFLLRRKRGEILLI